MLVTDSGIVIDVRLPQFSNALFPILVTELGIAKSPTKLIQDLKEQLPIETILFPSSIPDNNVQL